jgi:putative ABC transport system substrate-binding protein
MRRREFITALGGTAVAWPFAVRAQQPATPVIGFLDARLPDAMADRLRGFRQGLGEAGYVEGDNVTILYRWGENKVDRLPELAAELVRRRVTVIVASGGVPVIFAAKAATATIPVLFIVSEDPVRLGLVKSLARPEGNLTGINFYNSELVAKQLELLRELVPQAAAVAVLVNPASPNTFETTVRDIEPAARAMGLRTKLLRASTGREIDAAFAALASERPDALFVGNDAFFNSRRVQLVQLAAHHRLPAIYSGREYSEIGGLISYGTNIADAYRQAGLYAGRILKGAKPSDLPVPQSSKFELVINHPTARTLGLSVPDKLLVAADEVIE